MSEDDNFDELATRIEQSELDPEDLALVSESRLDELRKERNTLQKERKEPYAEALSNATGMSTDLLMDNDFEKLKDEYETRLEELEEEDEGRPEELGQSLNPNPKAQDNESETEELEEEEGEDTVVEDLSATDKKDLKELAGQIENYESAGGPWADAADSAREQFEDLADAEYEEVEVADL